MICPNGQKSRFDDIAAVSNMALDLLDHRNKESRSFSEVLVEDFSKAAKNATAQDLLQVSLSIASIIRNSNTNLLPASLPQTQPGHLVFKAARRTESSSSAICLYHWLHQLIRRQGSR
jgi:hypothetical protein